ncbi:hypothetical protein L9F63_000648, partial [Diploptera punctata]
LSLNTVVAMIGVPQCHRCLTHNLKKNAFPVFALEIIISVRATSAYNIFVLILTHPHSYIIARVTVDNGARHAKIFGFNIDVYKRYIDVLKHR